MRRPVRELFRAQKRTMRAASGCALASLACAGAAEAQSMERFETEDALHDLTTIHLGGRVYDNRGIDTFLGGVPSLGIEYAARNTDSGFGLEAAFFYAAGEGKSSPAGTPTELDLKSYEFQLGGRYTQRLGETSLFLVGGAGLDVMCVLGERTTAAGGYFDLDELAYGGYVHAGLYFELPGDWTLGADVRHARGMSLDIGPMNVRTAYTQMGLVFGTGF